MPRGEGRPAAAIDPAEVHTLREQGMSFRAIARQLGVSVAGSGEAQKSQSGLSESLNSLGVISVCFLNSRSKVSISTNPAS